MPRITLPFRLRRLSIMSIVVCFSFFKSQAALRKVAHSKMSSVNSITHACGLPANVLIVIAKQTDKGAKKQMRAAARTARAPIVLSKIAATFLTSLKLTLRCQWQPVTKYKECKQIEQLLPLVRHKQQYYACASLTNCPCEHMVFNTSILERMNSNYFVTI